MTGVVVRCRCGWVGDSGTCDHRISGEHCPSCDRPVRTMEPPRAPAGEADPGLVAILSELAEKNALVRE